MAAISQGINNVLGGISQQPDPVKIPGQVRDAVNVYLDPTFGASKRQGTEFIAKLATDIPEDAQWFPIFRDQQERYVFCLYRNAEDDTVLRVFAADSGQERTVTMKGSAAEYLEYTEGRNISALTINDYTFLSNNEKTISMSAVATATTNSQALVSVAQVAYNTTYAIDFLRDGEELAQEKIYRATRLSVSPASFDVEDAGACALASVENHVISDDGNDLGFQLRVNCSPTLVTGEEPGLFFPTRAERTKGRAPGYEDQFGQQVWCEGVFGNTLDYAVGSYLYTTLDHSFDEGDISVRVEVRVNRAPGSSKNYYEIMGVDIISYTNGTGDWKEDLAWVDTRNSPLDNRLGAIQIKITSVRQGESTPTYTYKSKYKVQVTLNNGGTGWDKGDTVSVTQGGKTYTVKVEETDYTYNYKADASVSFTTPADTASGSLDVGSITSNLVVAVKGLDNYDAEAIGNTIVITREDGRSFNLQTRGGSADQALFGIKDTVNDISRLPPQCQDGFTLRVSNSGETDADDYYVSFKTEGGIPGQGAWEETVKPNIETSLNEATMPHALIRKDDGSFEVRPLSNEYDSDNFWAPRAAGDKKTNPDPSFVGKTIKEAFFYQNRLGFISADSVVLSQAGDYFNFFAGSAIALSDADPVDMNISATRPAKLKAVLPTPSGLLLFAENSQFLLKSQDVAFGPSTANLNEVSSYAYNSQVKPVETGVSLLFHTESDTFSKVFEMSIESLDSRPVATENTRIVPELIPTNLTNITAVPNQSLVLFGDGSETMFAFKFYNSGSERQLAGWTKWEFATPIKLTAFDHDTGYFIGRNGDATILSRMELIDNPDTAQIDAGGARFQPRLDHYVGSDKLTTETLPDTSVRVRLPDGMAVSGKSVFLAATFAASQTFYVSGDIQTDATGDYFDVTNALLNTEFVVGLGYQMSVELPSFYVKEGDNNRADRRNYPMVESAYIDLYFSGRYDCIIKRLGYDDITVPLEIVRSDIYLANSSSIVDSATSQIPVFAQGNTSTLTILADGPLPASLTSYHWEGHYSTRGIQRR
jgi:hypothetical protein